MAKKITTDVSSVVDITARRNDSFYIKTTLTQEDGSLYNVVSSTGVVYTAHFEVYDANSVRILTFLSAATPTSNTTVNSVIDVDSDSSALTIDVPATNMTIREGVYKYKFYIKSDSVDNDTNTIMTGKFKIVDI